jgi:hypothetical protein
MEQYRFVALSGQVFEGLRKIHHRQQKRPPLAAAKTRMVAQQSTGMRLKFL